jgi:ubiquinone/menaquinone biosynthesis C-methylase UbiE
LVVAAKCQNLPFLNESFDWIICYQSIPEYLPETTNKISKKHEARICLKEMIRVVKPGGRIMIFPIQGENLKEVMKTTFGKNMKWLENDFKILRNFGLGGYFLIIIKNE